MTICVNDKIPQQFIKITRLAIDVIPFDSLPGVTSNLLEDSIGSSRIQERSTIHDNTATSLVLIKQRKML